MPEPSENTSRRRGQRLYRLRLALALLSFALSFLAFVGAGSAAILQAQVLPLFLRLLVTHAAGTAAMLAVLLLLTVLAGRFVCSLLCPFGILQDLLAIIGRRLPFVLAGLMLAMLAGGTAAACFELDPYSLFGRLASSASLASFTLLAVLLAVLATRPRAFCLFLCPVGAILNLLSRFTLLRLTMRNTCRKCGKCAKACPADCIDLKSATIDNARCLRCFRCLDACPQDSLTLALRPLRTTASAAPANNATAAVSASRRDFLAAGGLLVAGAAVGTVLTPLAKYRLTKVSELPLILPPGAENTSRLAAHCTGCQLCAAACPDKLFVFQNGFPVLDLSRGACHYDCHACSQACPTGAILPLTLAAKQQTRIATVAFTSQNCLLFKSPDTSCCHCADACPANAIIRVTAADGRVFPRFETARCLGCGSCFNACLAAPKAIAIKTIPEQQRLKPAVPEADATPRTVVFDPTVCRVLQNAENCGLCAKACPTGAITLRKRKSGLEIPQIKPEHCLACGACQNACPTRAMHLPN